jgi:hypothetical protein
MARSKPNDALTIREIEYSIYIKDKDMEMHELDNLLRSELTRFEDHKRKSENSENPIQKFLQTNIERSVVIRDNTKVFFLNYKEKGSLSIRFSVLVITRYVNYGSIRQALDYLIKDTIGSYFEELLERHVPVSVSVQSDDNELYEIPVQLAAQENIPKPEKRDLLPIILASVALISTLTIGLILIFQKNHTTESLKPTDDYKDKYYELLIEKQIRDAFDKEKLNYSFYKNMQSSIDSVQNLRFHENK